jgi:hypothetical protein
MAHLSARLSDPCAGEASGQSEGHPTDRAVAGAQHPQRPGERSVSVQPAATDHPVHTRPWRSTALIWAARFADIWLHPIAFLKGNRRRPQTFDDLRALGVLARGPGRPETAIGMEGDEPVSEAPETRIPMVH